MDSKESQCHDLSKVYKYVHTYVLIILCIVYVVTIYSATVIVKGLFPVLLTELHYPVTGSGNEVTGNGDGHTKEIVIPETLQNENGYMYTY